MTKEEFLTFFGEKEELKKKRRKKKKKKKKKPEEAPAPEEKKEEKPEEAAADDFEETPEETKMNEQTAAKWIAKYSKILEANSLTTEEAFSTADADKSGTVDLDELKDVLKAWMGPEKLSYNDMAQILNAFDTDGDGTITEEEYFAKVERSANFFEDDFEDDVGDQALPSVEAGTSQMLPT